MNNIILIGMPGCGKSTMGILLAKIAGFGFIDTDLLIQKRENRKLYRIIGESGPEYFKKVENEVGCSVDVTDTVIATGGSMVYGAEAMEHFMKVNGCTQSEYHEALGEANRLYLERNKVEGWATDLSWLKDNFGISPPFGR